MSFVGDEGLCSSKWRLRFSCAAPAAHFFIIVGGIFMKYAKVFIELFLGTSLLVFLMKLNEAPFFGSLSLRFWGMVVVL